MKKLFKGDLSIWMIYFFLCMISVTAIYSASSNLTFHSGNHWAPVASQAGFLLLGLVVMLLVVRIPCKYFKLIPIIGLPLAIIMLLYVLVMQKGLNDAARWINIFGVKFQPSEIAKTMLILEVAVILSKVNQKRKKLRLQTPDTKTTSPDLKNAMRRAFRTISAFTLITCGLIAPENFSTACMLMLVIAVMMYVGNIPKRHLAKAALLLLVTGLALGTVLMTTPDDTLRHFRRALTWKHRIQTKLHHTTTDGSSRENTYNLDEHWQETTSHIAIANSNVIGLGVGNSIERDFLPHAESDFIYSIIIEETGIFGALLVLILYLSLLIRSWRIATHSDKYFPAYLVIGLTLMLVVQALVNMSVAVGLAPVTGQTLPLISRGGTSILITSFNLGMILSVSRYTQALRQQEKHDDNLNPDETLEFASSEGIS